MNSVAVFSPGAFIPDHYAVYLSTGNVAFSVPSASIAQTGQFPDWARTLLFVSHRFVYQGNWEVTITDLKIPVTAKSEFSPGLFLYEGDISAFAGQKGELRFSALSSPTFGTLDVGEIQFSAIPIPEPSFLGLFSFGALMISRQLRCRSST